MMQTAMTRLDDRWAWADSGMCREIPDLFYNSEDEAKSTRRRKEAAAQVASETGLSKKALYDSTLGA